MKHAIYRLLMASRIALAALFVNAAMHDAGAVAGAVVASVLLHHYRVFDTAHDKRTCGEKAFYIVAGMGMLAMLLFGITQPWFAGMIRAVLMIMFGFLIPGVLSYLVLPKPKKPVKNPVDVAKFMVDNGRFYRSQSPTYDRLLEMSEQEMAQRDEC